MPLDGYTTITVSDETIELLTKVMAGYDCDRSLMQYTQLQRLLLNAMKLNLHASLPICSKNDLQITVEKSLFTVKWGC